MEKEVEANPVRKELVSRELTELCAAVMEWEREKPSGHDA